MVLLSDVYIDLFILAPLFLPHGRVWAIENYVFGAAQDLSPRGPHNE